MISVAELDMLIQSHQVDSFIFRRSLLPDSSDPEILADFEALLREKKNGAWLVRESRSLGHLTMTFKSKDRVRHFRFSLADDRWVGSNTLSDGQCVKSVDLSNLGEKGQELIELIVSKGFSRKNMLLPNDRQCTQKSVYRNVSYSAIEIRRIRYDDPVVAIKSVFERLTTIDCREKGIADIAGKRQAPLDRDSTDVLDELFTQWLRENTLDVGLICSIGLTLIRDPRVLCESGRSFDASSMAMIGTSCPITRIPIMQAPHALPEYAPILNACLDIFVNRVNEAWNRNQLSAPRTLSIFASSSSSIAPVPYRGASLGSH